ncbi:MAG: hypothetical protein HXY34_13430 [Candidatus Thorarchaeota archaeon]|nr:hypothetical protein [Candidatus Thorarchaeota archaeon]
MIVEVALLAGVYFIWVVSLVNSMVSSEEVSLTVSTLPFVLTFPLSLVLSAVLEPTLPGAFVVDVGLTIVVGVLLFVRWVMAIVGE